MKSISTNKPRLTSLFYAAIATTLLTQPALAYPEFQQFIEKNSHRTVNCAMCHVNEHGPVGAEKGQIASLNAQEMAALNEARRALTPGNNVKNPVLNQFGNEIINTLGKKEFLALKNSPEKLGEALSGKFDLDGDGIPDATEYMDGTDPLNKFHGDPAKLFFINLGRNKIHIILAIAGVFLLNFGLGNLIKAILIMQRNSSHN